MIFLLSLKLRLNDLRNYDLQKLLNEIALLQYFQCETFLYILINIDLKYSTILNVFYFLLFLCDILISSHCLNIILGNSTGFRNQPVIQLATLQGHLSPKCYYKILLKEVMTEERNRVSFCILGGMLLFITKYYCNQVGLCPCTAS